VRLGSRRLVCAQLKAERLVVAALVEAELATHPRGELRGDREAEPRPLTGTGGGTLV
jgi:hypothetical protein